MAKKTSFAANFGPFGPNLGPKTFLLGFYLNRILDIVATYYCIAISKKTKTAKLEKMSTNLVLGPIFAHLAQIWNAKVFFPKNLALSVTRYHDQLSSHTISEKNKDPILRKLSDGPADGQTGRQMDRGKRVIS